MTSDPPLPWLLLAELGAEREAAADPAPVRWAKHYPRMLLAYRREGEDGLEAIEEELRTQAASQPGGKFGKLQAAYTPVVPLPPFDWRHECGHCRFWVDEGPGKAGQCMIVGREGDPFGGKDIHEKAGCALFMPPAGEAPFAWVGEQLDPTGADLVRGEFHPPEEDETGERRARRHARGRQVGGLYVSAGTRVGLEPVIEGLAAPIAMEFHPDRDLRYVADQEGLVYVHDGDDLDVLLDLRERIVDLRTQYDERGLLGLALHPEFPDDSRVFVRYSGPVREGTPPEYDHTEVLSSFEVAEDGRTADPDSGESILEIPSPQFNHNAGAIEFGPDGHLYVAMGDGGNQGDQGPGHVEGGNAQAVTENLLGAILRIHVDERSSSGSRTESDDVDGDDHPYAVPDDNPLVDGEGIDELYAWGLRNPWSMSFDGDGRLFVADVGQHLYEEVNVVEKGGNYGWPIREGFHCFDPENPSDPPRNCPDESERGESLLDPIVEYPHIYRDEVVGSAVIGGHVYEGDAIPDLRGKYVFGDWTTTQDRPSGRLFAAAPPDGDGGREWRLEELDVSTTYSGRPERNVLGFARDPAGDLYVLGNETHVPTGETGAVLRVVPP